MTPNIAGEQILLPPPSANLEISRERKRAAEQKTPENVMGGGREWRGGDTGEATGPQSSEIQKSEYSQSKEYISGF